MEKRYVISLDQGTTSSRAVLFDKQGKALAIAQRPLNQIFPQPGWVEHDPMEILSDQLGVLTELLLANSIQPEEIDSLGITNQRETTILWNRKTGLPIANAIVWQCRRTAPMIEELCKHPDVTKMIQEKTGLIPDPYFSASKIRWLLDHVEGAQEAAEAGDLAFGTIDSWLIYKLTNGKVHATDPTNACRTMLYDIHKGDWDDDLLKLFGIPRSLCPEVRPSSGYFGETSNPTSLMGIPIRGVAGDQQSALFGQCCFEPGEAKNTYGTGGFMLMHTGTEAVQSHCGLITTIAASAPGTSTIEYALEGSVFMCGALIHWLSDDLQFIDDVAQTSDIAASIPDTGGVMIVPAFTGLGAPWWDADARGLICGITRGTKQAHIIRAALEALAYQSCDVLTAMQDDAQCCIKTLVVDGGASSNDFLMQYQADMLGCNVCRPINRETTAAGAAFLAGLSSGFWKSTDELKELHTIKDCFEPRMSDEDRTARLKDWHRAVQRARSDSERD